VVPRQKIASDPVYRQVCLESPRKWREANPDYWKRYRQDHPQQVERNRRRQHLRDQRRRLVNLANNNLAFDLKHSAAEVWLLGQAARPLANNNLAPCEVLIFHPLGSPEPLLPASCQQHPSGVAAASGL
jgi:23S rRNA G2445 N2-methylase RlmL